jgi:hypothetical protein
VYLLHKNYETSLVVRPYLTLAKLSLTLLPDFELMIFLEHNFIRMYQANPDPLKFMYYWSARVLKPDVGDRFRSPLAIKVVIVLYCLYSGVDTMKNS